MSSIDKRIVEMVFDNSKFESGVKTTMNSLDQLNKSLDMTEAASKTTEAFSALDRANLSGIASGVEALQQRFSTLGIIGMEVVQRLTNAVLDLGSKLMSTITSSIIQGGIKRSMNIENAHFMLQGLLGDEEEVQAIMDDAMTSVDGTAYAYDEAAKAASQFAATGLKAGEEMLGPLRAIAGTAAMTNAEYDRIAHIFTTVAGNGKLMGEQLNQFSTMGLNAAATLKDYFNDVNSGAATANEEVSAAIKNLSGGLEVTEEDIREFVRKGDLSFSIFSAAMDNAFGEHAQKANETFTGAMSNIKAALARIGANFIQPLVAQNSSIVELFNEIRKRVNDFNKFLGPLQTTFSDTVLSMAADAKEFFSTITFDPMYSERLGYIFTNVVETLKNVFKGLGTIIKPVTDAFREMFPTNIIQSVWQFTHRIKELTSNFKISEETADKLKRVFKGVFAAFQIGIDVIKALWDALKPLRDMLSKIASYILDVAAAFGDWLVELNETIKSTKAFGKAADSITPYLESFFSWINKIVTTVKEWLSEKLGLDTFFEDWKMNLSTAGDKMGPFATALEIIKKAFSGLWELLQDVFPVLKKAAGSVGSLLGDIFGAIVKVFKGEGFDTLLALANGTLVTTLGLQLTDFLGILKGFSAKQLGTNLAKGLGLTNLIQTTGALKNTLVQFQSDIKAGVLQKIAIAVATLAGSLWLLSTVDVDKLGPGLAAIGALMAELTATFSVFDSLNGNGEHPIRALVEGFQESMAASAMRKMAEAILILAVAIRAISGLDSNQIRSATIAISALMAVMTGVAVVMGKVNGFNFSQGATGLMELAVAIDIMVYAVKQLGDLDTETLAKGEIAIAALMGMMVAFQKLTKLSKGGKLSMNGIKGVDNGEKGFSGFAFVELAAALVLMAEAVKMLGVMDTETLLKGLGIVTVFLGEFVAISKLLTDSKNLVSMGSSILIISIALTVLAGAIAIYGTMNLETICKGLIAIGGALLIMGVALYAIPAEEALATAGALVVMSAAIALLTPSLMLLGSMKLESIGKALIILAGAFAVIGAASVILKKLTLPILKLSVALLAFSASLALICASVLMFAVAMSMLAVSGVAGATAFSSIIIILLGLIPKVCEAILSSLPVIKDTVVGIIGTVCETIIELAPQIAETIIVVVGEFLKMIDELAPQFFETLFDVIEDFLQKLEDHAEDFAEHGVMIVANFMNGIANKASELGESALMMVLSLINGLAEAIDNHHQDIYDAIGYLIEAVIYAVAEWVSQAWDKICDAGGDIIGGIWEGIKEAATKAWEIICDVCQTILDAFCDFFGIASPSTVMEEEGGYVMEGLFNGISDMIGPIVDLVTGLCETIAGLFKGLIETSAGVGEALYDGIHGANEGDSLDDYYSGTDLMFEKGRLEKAMAAVRGELDPSELSGDRSYYYYRQIQNALEAGEITNPSIFTDEIRNELQNMIDEQKNMIPSLYEVSKGAADAQAEGYSAGKDGIAEAGKLNVKAYTDATIAGKVNSQTAASDIVAAQKAAYDARREDFRNSGAANTQEFTNGTYSGKDNAVWSSSDIVESQRLAYENGRPGITAAGLSNTQGLTEGTTLGKGEALASSTNIINSQMTAYNDGRPGMVSAGLSNTQGLAEGTSSGKNTAVLSASDIVEAQKAAVNAKKQDFVQIGADLISGLISGINESKDWVAKAAASTVNGAAASARSAGKINSPSKVFEEIGDYMVAGLVVGLNNNKAAADAAANTGYEVIDSVNTALQSENFQVDDIIGSASINPVITPVMDLSELQNGFGSIDEYFNTDRSLELARLANRRSTNPDNLADVLTASNQSTSDKMVRAITDMRGDIANLYKSISEMKLVMDSGVLVGEIADQMDVRLGAISVQRGRGV